MFLLVPLDLVPDAVEMSKLTQQHATAAGLLSRLSVARLLWPATSLRGLRRPTTVAVVVIAQRLRVLNHSLDDELGVQTIPEPRVSTMNTVPWALYNHRSNCLYGDPY